jgi:hypothetical protein
VNKYWMKTDCNQLSSGRDWDLKIIIILTSANNSSAVTRFLTVLVLSGKPRNSVSTCLIP